MSKEQQKKRNEKNERYEKARGVYERFPDFEEFPVGLTDAPFKWEYTGSELKMCFISGFVGVELSTEGYIRPVFGWAIG